MTAAPSAFFLPGQAGGLFCLARGPWTAMAHDGRALLILPPFAEEMNRTRRLMHETLTALARHGMASLCCDLYGTGDSAGEFHQARWDMWLNDAGRAIAWMRAQGARHVSVLAIRLGALLALDLAGLYQDLFLLAPQLDGKRAMRQFLRIRAAADMERSQRGGGPGPGTQTLEAALHNGGTVTVAGYDLPGALYQAIQARPSGGTPLAGLKALHLIGLGDDGSAATALARDGARLSSLGAVPKMHILPGPAVWQQMEPSPAAALGADLGALILGKANRP